MAEPQRWGATVSSWAAASAQMRWHSVIPARDGDIGLEDVHGARRDQIAESKACLLVLTRRDRDIGGAAHLGEAGQVVG